MLTGVETSWMVPHCADCWTRSGEGEAPALAAASGVARTPATWSVAGASADGAPAVLVWPGVDKAGRAGTVADVTRDCAADVALVATVGSTTGVVEGAGPVTVGVAGRASVCVWPCAPPGWTTKARRMMPATMAMGTKTCGLRRRAITAGSINGGGGVGRWCTALPYRRHRPRRDAENPDGPPPARTIFGEDPPRLEANGRAKLPP